MIKKLLIIGKTPPPIGGVTIHVKRLLEHLDVNNIEYDFYDLSKFSFFHFCKKVKRYKYVHMHTSSPVLRLFFTFLCIITRTKSLITIHGNLNRYDKLRNLCDKISIRLSDYPIVINKYSYSIASSLNKRTSLLSAYIAPIQKESLPEKIISLLEGARFKNKSIVVTNAYAKSYDKNGVEIYGIDFLIHFFTQQRETDFILFISDPSGDYFKSHCNNMIDNERVIIIPYPHSFVGILKYADIYIRNTSTDGDSLSIHEALDLGVIVIATDIVDRPDNVILIKRDDKYGLQAILTSSTLNKEEKSTLLLNKEKIPEIISFYKKMYETNNTRP